MKEYKISNRWKTIIDSLALFAILVYGGLAVVFLLRAESDDDEQNLMNLTAVFFLIVVLIMILLILKAHMKKIIVSENSIKSVNLFKDREFMFNEIEGFNIIKNYRFPALKQIILQPISNETKSLVFNYSYLNHLDELESVLKSRLKFDSTIQPNRVDVDQSLENKISGKSIEEKTQKLEQAKLTAKVINIAAGIIGFWTFNYPVPYEYTVLACIAIPIISLIAIIYWNGLIRIDKIKNTIYPNVVIGIFVPTIVLFLRVRADYNIEDYTNIWIPAVLLTVALCLLLTFRNQNISFKDPHRRVVLIYTFLFLFGYAYSTIVSLNCTFDKSAADVYKTELLDKQSGYKSYDLVLSPWGKKNKKQEIKIDKDSYYELQNGDRMTVYVYKGLFGIPWIQVNKAH